MSTFKMRHNNLDWLVHVLHMEWPEVVPWQEDADGEVIQVRAIGAGGKRPGEVMLDGYLAADFSGALAQVRREGWGVTGSPEAIAWAARLFGAERRKALVGFVLVSGIGVAGGHARCDCYAFI